MMTANPDAVMTEPERGDDGPCAVQPGELEQEHARLMQLQSEQADGQQFVEVVRKFVDRVRELGRRLEDPKSRQHWQGVLTYWSIYAYRAAHIDLEPDLPPFDLSLSPSFNDDQYPYRFEGDAVGARQEMLGWRRLLDECEQDLAGDHFLTVVGDVGSGRKFLLSDLLVPILRNGRARRPELAGSEKWRYLFVRLGRTPLRCLVQAIAESTAREPAWVSRQVEALRVDPTRLANILEIDSNARTLLVFESFGSLLGASEEERGILVRGVAALLEDPAKRYFVAVTLRPRQTCDFSLLGPLEHFLQDGHVVMAFTTAELRHLIEQPAQRIGLVFDNGLVDQIMIDIQGETTSLRLLEFTLSRLWEHRERNRITWEAYRKVGAGTNALRIAMDQIYGSLDRDQQELFKKILLAMITLEPNSGFAWSELPESDLHRICGNTHQVDQLLDLLRRQRLLHERTIDDKRVMALNNSAILRAWPPLVAWLDELQVRHRFRLRLKEAATLWQSRGKRDDSLWRGAMLVEADQEFGSDFSLTTPELEFLTASRRRQTFELRRRNLIIGGIVTLILAALTAFPFALLHHDSQERLSLNAMACISDGDVSGALLWLDERKRNIYFPFLGRRAQDELLRQFSQAQLPEVSYQLASQSHSSNGRSDSAAESTFGSLALSQDGLYVATVSSKAVKDKNETEYSVEVTSLAEEQTTPLVVRELQATSASEGYVAFMPHPTDDSSYLIAGIGDRLLCWQSIDSHGKKWATVDLRKPDETQNSTIVDVDAGADLLAITRLAQNGSRSLSLYRLTRQETGHPALEPVAEKPDGLEGNNVRLASLSSRGDLVVVFGSEMEQATILKAWRKERESYAWTLAKPPSWVNSLQEKDIQRLYDYGWTLTKDPADKPSWQRDGSFVRAVSFSPSGLNFATASDDGQVVLWSVSETETTPEKIIAPKIETELQLGRSVYDVTFLNDDEIATGGRDRTARIWNVHSGTEILPRVYHEGTVHRVQFVPHSHSLITSTNEIWRKWDFPKHAHITTDDSDSASTEKSETSQAAAPSPSTGGDSSFVSVFFVRHEKWICTVHKNQADSTFSINIRRSSAREQTDALEKPFALDHLAAFPLVDVSPDDRFIIVAEKAAGGKAPPRVFLWDLMPDAENSTAVNEPLTANIGPIAGESFAGLVFQQVTIGRSGGNHVVALVGAKEEGHEQKKGVIYFGSLKSRERNRKCDLLPMEADMGPTSVAQAAAAPRFVFPHEQPVLCVGFSPTGEFMATGDVHDCVKLWDVQKLVQQCSRDSQTLLAQKIAELEHSSDVESLSFSQARAGLLATVSSEGEASIWSLSRVISTARGDKDRKVRSPDHKPRHDAKILCASFSPSGEMIITGGLDRAARVWNLNNGSRGGQGKWASCELVGIFLHANPVIEAWMPLDNQVNTLCRVHTTEKAIPEGIPASQFQMCSWTVSKGKPLSTDQLQERAGRRVIGSELQTLDVADFRTPMARLADK